MKPTQAILFAFSLTLCSCGGFWAGTSPDEPPPSETSAPNTDKQDQPADSRTDSAVEREGGHIERELGEEFDSLREPVDSQGSTGYGCCKHCDKGKPCGDTCIPRSHTCRTSGGCACW